MPCSTYARAIGAVPSGRSVSERSLRSANVYISLVTTSEASPAVRAKRAVSSKPGVWMRRQPYCAACSSIVRTTCHQRCSAGRTSCVPRGAWNLGGDTQLAQERVRVELAAERRLRAVARMDDGVAPEPLDEQAHRVEQLPGVAAGEVG